MDTLLARLRAGTGADREADLLVWLLVGERLGQSFPDGGRLPSPDPRYGPHLKPSEIWNGRNLDTAYALFPSDVAGLARTWGVPEFTTSMNAAMSIVDEGLISELICEAMDSVGQRGWMQGTYRDALTREFVALALEATV